MSSDEIAFRKEACLTLMDGLRIGAATEILKVGSSLGDRYLGSLAYATNAPDEDGPFRAAFACERGRRHETISGRRSKRPRRHRP